MDRELERLLDPDYLGEVTARPLEELRAMRAECQEVETGLSYGRRLIQGRLDIAEAERTSRARGERADAGELLARLPQILADRTRTPGVGRLPQLLAPGEVGDELIAELDRIVDGTRLAMLADLSDADLDDLVARLQDLEQRTSARRRAMFTRIDTLSGEITRRYRDGEASVEALLRERS